MKSWTKQIGPRTVLGMLIPQYKSIFMGWTKAASLCQAVRSGRQKIKAFEVLESFNTML